MIVETNHGKVFVGCNKKVCRKPLCQECGRVIFNKAKNARFV